MDQLLLKTKIQKDIEKTDITDDFSLLVRFNFLFDRAPINIPVHSPHLTLNSLIISLNPHHLTCSLVILICNF